MNQILSSYSQHGEQLQLYLDIPYPSNKPRIKTHTVSNSGKIHTGKLYNFLLFTPSKGQENCIIISPETKLNVIVGDIIYYGDGVGAWEVMQVENFSFLGRALNDFQIWAGKSIMCGFITSNNLIEPLNAALKQFEINRPVAVALSFITEASEIKTLKQLLCVPTEVIAKIETPESIKNIEEICCSADGIMLARGDMGLYNDYADLYLYIEHVISVAKRKRKEVHLATDVLASLRDRYIPSRADVVDLFVMTRLGCNAVILNNEPDLNYAKIEHKIETINAISHLS